MRHYHTDPRLIARARSLVADLPSMDHDAEIRAVWDFIRGNVRYVRDPLGAEHVTSPKLLDQQVDAGVAQEDCESIALYAATLLAAIGLPSWFDIQGRRPDRPLKFTHCALIAGNPRTRLRIPFDPIGWYEYGDQFQLGDSLHLDGTPEQFFSLDGRQVDAGGMLGAAFADEDEQEYAAAFLSGDAWSTTKSVLNVASDYSGVVGPYAPIVSGLAKGAGAIGDYATHSSGAGAGAAAGADAGAGTINVTAVPPPVASSGATSFAKRVMRAPTQLTAGFYLAPPAAAEEEKKKFNSGAWRSLPPRSSSFYEARA